MLTKLASAVRHWFHLLIYSWRAIGPAILGRKLLAYASDPAARNVDSGFDARFGTDTNAELTPTEADLPPGRRTGATMYLPTIDADLEEMLAALGWSEARLRQTTFVDIGSGKGRAVFLAAMHPFREVVGVELSPVLHTVAESNLELMRRSGALVAPARLWQGDATELDVPRGPWIAYLYHPFREPTAARVVDRLVASLAGTARPAAILYGHPTMQRSLDGDVFARGGLFRQAGAGARATRRFKIGWTIWTNQAWLDDVQVRPAWDARFAADGPDPSC